MLSNSPTMIKIDQNRLEVWQTVCKKNTFIHFLTLVHLLVLLF